MKTFVFNNHFEASVAAAEHRNKGYAVEVHDETVATLWGPLAVGGVRIVVGPKEEDESCRDDDALAALDTKLDALLRWAFVTILACGCLFLFFNFALSPVRMLFALGLNTILAVGYVALVGLIAESTRKLFTIPAILGLFASVLIVTQLFVG